VELEEIDRIHTQVRAADVDILANVRSREDLAERDASPARPQPVLGRDLGRHEDALAGVAADDTRQELLATAVAVDLGAVEEVHAS
jgi:hypothetical protein